MPRYFYYSDIQTFLDESDDQIFGKLAGLDEYDSARTQKNAWAEEIVVMKQVVDVYKSEPAWIAFEYTIPRIGKRIDVVLLLRERVFVIEFKAGEDEIKHADMDQVLDYALDLKNFHQGSADRMIVPILVPTENDQTSTFCRLSHYDDGIYEPMVANKDSLGEVISSDLHLAVSMRSYRAESLSRMVHYLLEGNVAMVRQIYQQISERYPIVITRNLDTAKSWLKKKSRGSRERYGLLVSSKGYRLKPLAIDVRCKPDTVHWFLDDANDVRSSLFLEDVASEFDVQGLELDWTCLVWDGDFRYTDGGWDYYEFNGGNRWNRIKKAERQAYQLNAYRVLLTRARQGMVICVPEGNCDDTTRLPEFYDGTYQYLKSLGFVEI